LSHNIYHLSNRCKGKWLIGSSALPEVAQSDWNQYLPEESELQLLALIGHSYRVGFSPSPPDSFTCKPLLPALDLPTLPEHLRPLLKQALLYCKNSHIPVRYALETLAQRHWAPHPTDWIPVSTTEDIPEAYHPWRLWLSSQQAHITDQSLSADNWDEFYPSERLKQVQQLRAVSPDAARELLQTCASREPAEKRVKLIATLALNLSTEDADYLNTLLQDRSQKIKHLATQFLMRLGLADAPQDDIAELAEYFSLKKKLASRRLALKPLKTNAQKSRRLSLCTQVPIHALAQHLDLTPETFLKAWEPDPNKQTENDVILTLVSTSASDDLLDHLGDPKTWPKYYSLEALSILSERLSDQTCAILVSAMLAQGSASLPLACEVTRQAHIIKYQTIKKNPAYKELVAALSDATKNVTPTHHQSLANWHYLATPSAAQSILEELKPHMMEAAPILSLLKLNSRVPLGEDH